ncbi:heme biosynthesis protein HemY [Aestuariispira ectoiniformans]|uniref:heme biosynthesis protein HemY n=1 Tax=Aestuariispira ectoiniformans TaxID=2775080 RepID=UPI00223B5B29|nr:heme biosynthesis HemY N-terminal domain-containing protein [Aestuariispira ectoiniformans]
MTRGLLLLIKVLVLAGAAFWLAEQPGQVTLEWQGWRLDTTVGIFLLATVLFGLSLAFLIWLFRSVWGAPKAYSRFRSQSRRERGYRALTQGLVAVAAGDKYEAARQSRRANALLNDPPLTMLLSAQSAQLAGDDKAATDYFKSMLDQPDAAFLGVRGLMMQAIKSGDKAEALRLAKKANELRPDTPWVLKELMELQLAAGDVDNAIATLDRAVKVKAISAEQGTKRKADLLMAKSRQAREEHDADRALKFAGQAQKLDPQSVEAITIQARLLIQQGKSRKAERLIEEAWKTVPCAALANAYRDASTETDMLYQVKRFEGLLAQNPDHAESHIALARISLDAKLWGEARSHLKKLDDSDVTPRVCRMMAELEEAEHGDLDAARRWLERASADEQNGEI